MSYPHGYKFLRMYEDLLKKGKLVETRGGLTRELLNYRVQIQPYDYMTSFAARKFNLKYAKRELLWYFNGDKFDDSIEQYADMWKKIKTPDGSFNSNYGQYLFAQNQIDWVVRSLERDMFSRQAVVQLLNISHQYDENPDVVCTKSIQFLIRNNKLHMIVDMRSNDAIFGFTNDVFCFGHIHMLVWLYVKETYPDLKLGTYTHDVASLHVYERHFKMLEALVEQGWAGFIPIVWPKPERLEDMTSLLNYGPGNGSPYANWILDA